MNKTIIVSNRLPLQITINDNNLAITPSVGGLATGMKSVHEGGESLWIGWSGLTEEDLDNDLVEKVNNAIAREDCAAVSLTQKDLDNFYYGFSNNTLWPMFHYFMEYTAFEGEYWESYKEVNRKFADTVLQHTDDGDTIWVHDYQLLLLPGLIKKERPNTSIGFFLHIPFPSYEVFRTLPWREELLNGMLGADLLGFHTYDYERHFLSSVRRILRLDTHFNEISYQGRTLRVDSFPMGIDYDKFRNAAIAHNKQTPEQKSDLQKRLDAHLQSAPDAKMILSIDRLDYTKGIPNRLRAFEYFLDNYPQFKEKVRFILLAVPSRSNVPQYQLLKKETDELVGRINGKFATVNWTPIWYFYRSMPFENLIDLYTSCEVALITPVRDGMNLVAKEYIATRTDKDGVLVLSEMAGAAKEMNEALLINPNNFEQVAGTLKKALEMPEEEQKERNIFLQQRLERYSVEKWAGEFMKALKATKTLHHVIVSKKITPEIEKQLFNSYQKAGKRLIFLDYDGTLVNFTNKPKDAKPDSELYTLLDNLNRQENTELVIISGRDRETFDEWFGDQGYTLIVEHGVWLKVGNREWQALEKLKRDWMINLRPIIETFVDRTPGTFIEEKNFSLAWHFRKADPELAQNRATELKTVLTSLISNYELSVLEGNKVIEIKSSNVNKGRAASRVLAEKDYDFIFAIGDDWTDEYMFKELPEEAFTVKVGLKKTSARYYVENTESVRELLKGFLNGVRE
ncbi:bifunctional alpha,alpha-trehalose-phosphate synthase (UDP-forming)/trehalose-phosphatase [Sinomicrobium weinanense]|uniref:Alpha,alpha-trehalose-phosphate synthase n=1 Tax=Sinomicrobium weinanense TaxID=2842200 RepID=A0A926Q2Q1_9FLAO|nr:bifunctional alpha,alpha-trehalose-phosphate synthase (UDP-forming)/trehalose-phosphatase [Sinomicrobium weinanense]MBC9796867.1 bifunctional alpha,alpha-trehalose-phosphate synthase (UDP-forming)/trehalose-phosphatase [Sinomicrobium weinanense]MBU3123882.1 bifunctional alpha,alpha-trehalose-phosphate synthase (UDP-forming)/trehalose-phosphatase [Sinomicrobium weinanense]